MNPFTFFSRIGTSLLFTTTLTLVPLSAQQNAASTLNQSDVNALWRSDNGDGTYRNPIIYGDYSDPDVIKHGNEYYLVSSSFNKVPGIPILKSTDLINWTLIGYALDQLHPVEPFFASNAGNGVWAPAIRFHNDYFYIYYPNYPFGIYMVQSQKIEGPWSDPILVDPNPGAIDPCPYWDENGQGWLMLGWAKSKAGFNNMITLKKLKPNGAVEQPEGPGLIIIDGNTMPPIHTSVGDKKWNTLEGPKIYKKDGWFYVFAPAGSVKPGFQAVFRSKSIEGPYEARNVLDQGDTEINGPHQGAWVSTASGEDWFIHFQDRDTYGRVVMLQPMKWIDGWPLMGKDHDDLGLGKPVESYKKPIQSQMPKNVPSRIEEHFDGKIGIAWQWNANPIKKRHSLTANPGFLRLDAVNGSNTPLLNAGSITQKFLTPNFTAITKMKAFLPEVGEKAGLLVLGNNSGWIALTHAKDGSLTLEAVDQTYAHNNGPPEITGSVTLSTSELWLKVDIEQKIIIHNRNYKPPFWLAWKRDEQAMATFSYSLDGNSWIQLGKPVQTDKGRWVGAQVGLFALAPRGTKSYDTEESDGYGDFDFFIIEKK